jgi:hypothetical protein
VVSSKKVTLTGKNYEELDKKRDELFKGLASPHNANQIIQVQVEDVENNQQVITILYHAGN